MILQFVSHILLAFGAFFCSYRHWCEIQYCMVFLMYLILHFCVSNLIFAFEISRSSLSPATWYAINVISNQRVHDRFMAPLTVDCTQTDQHTYVYTYVYTMYVSAYTNVEMCLYAGAIIRFDWHLGDFYLIRVELQNLVFLFEHHVAKWKMFYVHSTCIRMASLRRYHNKRAWVRFFISNRKLRISYINIPLFLLIWRST